MSPASRSDERGGDDGRGLRAKPPDAEPLERAAVLARKLQFAFRPAALGADEEGRWVAGLLRSLVSAVGVEDDFRPVALDDVVERRCGSSTIGMTDRARLLHRLEDDLPPALRFAAIALGADLDAVGDERDDRADAELRRFLQDDARTCRD